MRKNISELGSMMIEALAMLALIALVTPMLYKKSAERTMELQDINAASELRAIVKAVDDYVSSNYDAITSGETVTNTCGSQDYASFDGATDAHLEVPIGHFCEFLPYGILDADGNAKPSKLFSADYKVILKLKGSADPTGDKVVTAFVVTDPQGTELQTVRASSIASMIGGNGGFVSETSGDDEEASGKISGNLGIWGIDNTRSELGVSVKKGAVVAASIQGVSSQNAKLDLSGVLYREEKSDVDLNTMSTTLYMGAKDAVHDGNNIVNIGKLIVGAQEAATESDRLYINSGDVRIGTEGQTGNLYLDGTGNITVADGGLAITGGDIVLNSKAGEGTGGEGETPLEGGNLFVAGTISAAADAFTVAADGAVRALSYIAGTGGDEAVQIHIASGSEGGHKTIINEPLEVEAVGDCAYSGESGNASLISDCALYVKGSALIDGNLSVTDSFSAKNLHAQEKLTVGGDGPDDSKALSVVYNKGAEGAEGTSNLNFGDSLLRVSQTGDKRGEFNFADNFVNINVPNTEDGDRTFNVNDANLISLETQNDSGSGASGAIHMNEASVDIGSLASAESYALMSLQGADSSTESGVAGSIRMEVSNYLSMNDEAFLLTHGVGSEEAVSTNEISSRVKSFKITPSDISDDDKYFEVSENTEGDAGDAGQVLMKGIKTYMLDADQYLRNSAVHVQSTTEAESGATYNDVVRIGENSDTNSQIDISGEKIVAHEKGSYDNSNKVIKIDLSAGVSDENGTTYIYAHEDYPIYIRRGAIEMREGEDGPLEANTYKNYVQADRFVANHAMESGALIDHAGTALTGMKYEVNPAYTSVMHDIKLTTRGGARLSDVLPDFINKGIYVVDNTYPAKGVTCGQAGSTIEEYKGKSRSEKQGLTACTNISQEVSPWAGFVPSPTCPPGYSKVITLTPASFAMAQAGIPFAATDRGPHVDLSVPLVVKSPFDYQDESVASDAAPVPLYYQKNTWLKSFVDVYPNTDNFEGWDVGMGFIYPYNLYKEYIDSVGGKAGFDNAGCDDNNNCVIWNMFPVYAGTLEGYATVYCYFNRGSDKFNDSMVDTKYDQLNNFREPSLKVDAEPGTARYLDRLNDKNPDRTWSVW